jgi:signal transduction histidine kinase
MPKTRAPLGAPEGYRAALAGTSLLLVLVVLSLRDVDGPSLGLESIAVMGALFAELAVLCAGVLFYVHWRIGLAPSDAWLSTAVVAFGLQGLNWYVLVLGTGPRPAGLAPWIATYQIVTTLGLFLLVVWSERLPVRHDPLVAGVLLGLLVTLGRAILLQVPLAAPSEQVYAAVIVGLVLVSALNTVALGFSQGLSPWLRRRLCAVTILLGVGQAAAFPQNAPSWLTGVSICSNVLGGALLALAAFWLARRSIQHENEAVAVLQRRLHQAEMGQHDDQARLHELRATIAGLASVTRLLHHHSGIGGMRREQLGLMLEAELDRMSRLMAGRSAAPPEAVDVDRTLEPVVVRHRAAGARIDWQHTGTTALGRPDDIAEIVNILLTNAQRHAGRGSVALVVRTVPGCVEVVVSDSGPGIDRGLRHRIFEWGGHGPGSTGEGIGLATARVLSHELNGYLRLDDEDAPGATFVLGIPTAEEALRDRACTA